MKHHAAVMGDGYEKGEEKFGCLTSVGYLIVTKLGALKAIYAFALNDIIASGSKSILDIGTGVAELPLGLGARRNLEIFAVDPSAAMVRIAKFRTRGCSNIRIALGSSRHIPFKRRFSLIVSTLSFHHWANRDEALLYLKGFLTKNGEIRIYEYNKSNLKGPARMARAHSMDKDDFEELARRSGLKVRVYTNSEFIKAVFR